MRSTQGNSLLEVLLACCVFVVAFLFMLGVFPVAAGAIRQGNEVLAATFLAEQRLEAVRALPYDSIVGSTETVELSTCNNGVTCVTRYTVQTLVEPVAGQPLTVLKGVRALVSWQGQLARHLEVATYVAK
jgi:hypothetical protein